MDEELSEKVEEVIEDGDTRAGEIAQRLDVPLGWLFYELQDSPRFQLGEKKSGMRYDHEVEVV